MTVTIAVLIRSSRSLKGKSGATGNPSLRSMCSRSSIASAPVKIERPPPAFGAADPMWAGSLRADVTDARPATGYWFLEVGSAAGLRQIKPSKCSGGRHKVAPDTAPPPPRAADKKAAVDTSQGGLFAQVRPRDTVPDRRLSLAPAHRRSGAARRPNDTARGACPACSCDGHGCNAADRRQWLAVRVLGLLVIEARCELDIGEPAARLQVLSGRLHLAVGLRMRPNRHRFGNAVQAVRRTPEDSRRDQQRPRRAVRL